MEPLQIQNPQNAPLLEQDPLMMLSQEENTVDAVVSQEIIENDILASLETLDANDCAQKESIKDKVVNYFEKQKAKLTYNTRVAKNTLLYKIFSFLCSYFAVSAGIFTVLLVSVNFQAYSEVIGAYINPDNLTASSNQIFNSLNTSKIQVYANEDQKSKKEDKTETSSLTNFTPQKLFSRKDGLSLDVEITPYENRIIIPKIGKNIPLVDVDTRKQIGVDTLEDIFMNELTKGVIRYPGTAYPGEEGNAFIFGHSSNYPWMKGDYNDVFALLDNVDYGDEIVIYYKQKKYTYVISEKKVVKPGDVKILQRQAGKKELSLMTCWPVGTTLNRMIVVGQLKDVK